METIVDCIIVGAGPAGLSAAVNLRQRGKKVFVLNGGASLLEKAERVDNYLGMPGMTGAAMMQAFRSHAEQAGAVLRDARVGNIMPFDGQFMVNAGGEILHARTVILACGISKAKPVSGEAEFLGRGVSYCATCDGMLYRGKNVVVWGLSPDAAHEAAFLQNIGCRVTYIAGRRPETLAPEIPFVSGRVTGVEGDSVVRRVLAGDTVLQADGLFVLRSAAPADALVPGLELDGGTVKTDAEGRTSIPGLFAAGDITGTPLQVARAVGQGLVAGLCAADLLDKTH